MSGESAPTTNLPVDDSLPVLSEDAACDLINAWSSQGFFRLRFMGDKIFLTQMLQGVAYTAHLQTQYERRTVRHAQVPFRGGAIDDRGRAPAPWEIDVASPRTFEERTEIVPIPHTERVQICGECHGQRRVTCSMCAGTGRTLCNFCHGRGVIQTQTWEATRDAAGNTVQIPRMTQRPCHCMDGRITCSTCLGACQLTCPTCTGSGSIKSFEELVVRFQVAAKGELVDVTPVPDKWLAKRTGDALLNMRETRIDNWKSLPEAAHVKVKELIDRSHEVDGSEYRILLQQLRVERIPIHEVQYKYAGEEKKLWICGVEQAIYAPGAPWNRARMYGLFAAVVIPLALIGYWLILRFAS